jgi:hypothetical protein
MADTPANGNPARENIIPFRQKVPEKKQFREAYLVMTAEGDPGDKYIFEQIRAEVVYYTIESAMEAVVHEEELEWKGGLYDGGIYAYTDGLTIWINPVRIVEE